MTDAITTQAEGPFRLAPREPRTEAQQALDMIERVASDATIDISRLEKLFELRKQILAEQKQIEAERARREFDKSMAEAQADIEPAVRNKKNTHTNSTYADLAAVHKVVLPIITRRGFATTFTMGETAKPQHYRIICRTSNHGHTQIDEADFPFDEAGAKGGANKTPLHGFKSVVTYAQRILTLMIWNVATEDDDENAGGAGPVITADQAEQLAARLKTIDRTPDQFVAWYAKFKKLKLATLADIPATMFEEAKEKIEDTIAEVVKKRSNAQGGA